MILAIQILHILVSAFLVLVILLQAGKGAGMGAAFGGAGSQTVFGGRGAQTFLGKLTAIAAAIFFLTSLALSYAASSGGRSVVEGLAPATTAPTTGPADSPMAPAGTKAEPGTTLVPVAPPGAEGQAPAAPEGQAPAAPAPAPEGQAPAAQ
jgi:preprotein translocase subunit SecG